MHGRMVLAAITAVTTAMILVACGSTGPRRADCWDCVNEPQAWKKFPFESLVGAWRGNIEVVSNDTAKPKKERAEKSVEIRFETVKEFSAKRGISGCGALPPEGVVLVGQVWDDGSQSRVYEVFGRNSDGTVSYGRASLEKSGCSYRAVGGNVGMNRLAYPSVAFSQRKTPNGRVLASGTTPEFDVSFEFLHFEPAKASPKAFPDGGRKPMAVEAQDKPPLLMRVFRMNRQVDGPFARGEWTSTEEHLYRLWRAE